ERIEIRCPAVKVSRRHHRQQHGWRLTRHSHRATGPVWLTTQLPVFHGNIEITQESSSVNRNLVQVIRSVKVRSALSDVADFRNEMHQQLALNGQIPLMHRGILDVAIKCSYCGSLRARLGVR